MFRRKIQCECGKSIDRSFSYCPFCGLALKQSKESKERSEPDNLLDALDAVPFMFRFPFKKLFREIEQEFRELDKEFGRTMSEEMKGSPQSFSQGISISIHSSSDGMPVIRVKRFGPEGSRIEEIKEEKEEKERKQAQQPIKLTKEQQAQLEKLAKLPREEPATTVRRLSDRIIYEITLPGIKDSRNIMINRLENSIEIKAFTKDKAYFKLIPLSLPIKRHYLEHEKLILELSPRA